MWFPDGQILGVDIDMESSEIQQEIIARGANITGNVEIRIADVADTYFLKDVLFGENFNVIIDDADHRGESQVHNFEQLFPSAHLLPGGVYWVEDVTEEYAISYFRNLVDVSRFFGTGLYEKTHLMDYAEYQRESASDWGFLIESVSFHGELVVIEKRDLSY